MDWKTTRVTAILEQALVEDHATHDATTELTLDPKLSASATIVAKQDCVLAGGEAIPRVLEIFRKLDKTSTHRFEVVHHPEMFDGVRVRKGQSIAVIRGNARTILACERVTLNLLQRMCGIATETRKYVDAVVGTGRGDSGYAAKPHQGCACWISMPSVAEAGRIIAWISPMAC